MTTILISDLKNARTDANKAAVDKLIANAERLQYHDFQTTRPAPKIDLYKDLVAANLIALANNVQEGKYDDDDMEK